MREREKKKESKEDVFFFSDFDVRGQHLFWWELLRHRRREKETRHIKRNKVKKNVSSGDSSSFTRLHSRAARHRHAPI